ncbi:MAG TPA: hypothetical protein VJ814_09305 [Gaiellaceae bacterium]|nr:hypothetical protein [Gaiellaceae bacterium]
MASGESPQNSTPNAAPQDAATPKWLSAPTRTATASNPGSSARSPRNGAPAAFMPIQTSLPWIRLIAVMKSESTSPPIRPATTPPPTARRSWDPVCFMAGG